MKTFPKTLYVKYIASNGRGSCGYYEATTDLPIEASGDYVALYGLSAVKALRVVRTLE